ncbi:FHA domain-containing protein [bacterium]|nr:FHA domain-containing protein [bacterium]
MSAALQQKPDIKIKMTVVKGPHSGQVFQLSKSSFTIGRGPENDVVLMNDPQISRTHAKVSIVDRDLEVANMSQKNSIVVEGQSVQKWKIVNNSNFTVGDSEFNVEYDLGAAVISVPTKKPAAVAPIKPKLTAVPPKGAIVAKPLQAKAGVPVNRGGAPALRPQTGVGPQQRVNNQVGIPRQGQPIQNFNPNLAPNGNYQATAAAQTQNGSLMANPKFKFYLIAAIAIGGAYFYLFGNEKTGQAKKVASTLIYGDEMTKMNTVKEQERIQALEEAKKLKLSPQKLRIEENFVRGMRDFQLGNYSRAQEFFQLVLNLDSDHQLSKRYLYLSKVRFDEVVQEKLMLGESYFKKHNFKMCASLYRQVMDMLNGKSNDQKYILAEKKATECELASEGIR